MNRERAGSSEITVTKGIRGNIIQTMTIKFTALETCCDSYCVGSVSGVLKQFSSQI